MPLFPETSVLNEHAVCSIAGTVSYFQERSTYRVYLARCSCRRFGVWPLERRSIFRSAVSIVISMTFQTIVLTTPVMFVYFGGVRLVSRLTLRWSMRSACLRLVRWETYRATPATVQGSSCSI